MFLLSRYYQSVENYVINTTKHVNKSKLNFSVFIYYEEAIMISFGIRFEKCIK